MLLQTFSAGHCKALIQYKKILGHLDNQDTFLVPKHPFCADSIVEFFHDYCELVLT